MIAAVLCLLVSWAFVPAHAFTNGSLIPPYFCSPTPDGLPKSLGQLIPYAMKDQSADLAFNANTSEDLKVVPVTGSKPGNAGYILASLHNTQNRIEPIQHGLHVSVANGTTIWAGKHNHLNLYSGNDSIASMAPLSTPETPAEPESAASTIPAAPSRISLAVDAIPKATMLAWCIRSSSAIT